MNKEELLKLSPGELTDLGICPTCFNRENGGALYGDNSDKMLLRMKILNASLSAIRAAGHMCISTMEHYHDMSEAPDHINEKIIRFAKRFMQILCEVYGCERVLPVYHVRRSQQSLSHPAYPRYPDEKRGSQNFCKAHKAYVPDHAKLEKVRTRIHEYAQGRS